MLPLSIFGKMVFNCIVHQNYITSDAYGSLMREEEIMAGLSITGQLKVSTLQNKFLKEFGLMLRVYDGRALADTDQTLAQARKHKGSGSGLSVAKNMKVGNLERKFQVEFGLKVQVAGSDDSYLCNDDFTLNAAQLEDEKKLIRKAKKALREENNDRAVDDDNDVVVVAESDIVAAAEDSIEVEADIVAAEERIEVKVDESDTLIKETPLGELSEPKSTNITQADQATLIVGDFDLSTGELVDGSNPEKLEQQSENDASAASEAIKEVELSDLVVTTESINLPQNQEAFTFDEFDLKD